MTKYWFAAALVAAVSIGLAAPASAAVIVITHSKALAGGITPPDTPGYPITLSLPGAYRLDTNLTVPAGKQGINVRSHYVNIDMNGFRLYGLNAAGDTKLGTYGVYSAFGIGSIRNGIITGFRFDGIFLTGNSNNWTVENMNIQANGGSGIHAPASNYSRYLNNTVILNSDDGIACGLYCHVEGNTVSDNDLTGISMSSGTALGNTIFANTGLGLVGAGKMGFGNNTVVDNNAGGTQASGGTALHPNVCAPVAC